ncbi:MAG: BON domain-containing protein [Opitutae bacterium]|nr:BON domain-containing protein [Opitutae bacterium]
MKKFLQTSVALFLVTAPLALLASPATDRKVENAARQSYNYRAVLDNAVTAQCVDGHVTLSGVVPDADAQALAADTAANLPGVTKVTNNVTIKPAYTEHSDAWIAFKIRSRLLVKANVSAFTTVTVQDGVATLSGTASTLAQKELTGIYAAEIDHVKSVTNNLAVMDQPTLSEKVDDASITAQVKFALLSHRSTSALHTTIATTDGVVLISGNAASAAEKSLVTKLAKDVRGTASVTNNMAVKS